MRRTLLAIVLAVAAGCGEEGMVIVDAAVDGSANDGGADEDAAVIDGAVIDGPVIDGPVIDGAPLIDGAVFDAGAIDAALPIDAATPIDAAPPIDAAQCTVGVNDLVAATLSVTTDDNTKIYVNGVLIADTPYIWSQPQQYTVMIYRHPSRTNTIAFEGINLQNAGGYDRGILADLTFTVNGAPQTIVTGTTFRATNTLTTGWQLPGFDDSAWPIAFDEGPHGMAPWGAVFSSLAPGTTARWIWTYDSSQAPTKPQIESTYARRTFQVVDALCMLIET